MRGRPRSLRIALALLRPTPLEEGVLRGHPSDSPRMGCAPATPASQAVNWVGQQHRASGVGATRGGLGVSPVIISQQLERSRPTERHAKRLSSTIIATKHQQAGYPLSAIKSHGLATICS